MIKRVLSFVMCAVLICSCAFVSAYAKTSEEVDTHLQFGKDGGFITLPKERGIYILRVATPNEKRNFKVYVL